MILTAPDRQSIRLMDARVLDLDHTLSSGQAFRWKRVAAGTDAGAWVGALSPAGEIIFADRVGDDVVIGASSDGARAHAAEFFRVDDDLSADVDGWLSGHHGPEIAGAVRSYPGLRVLRQDPVECLFSFMMSAAAPIFRIRRSMDQLCRRYGRPLGEAGGHMMHAFPGVEILAEIPRSEYDVMGFGFRGGNICVAARQVQDYGGEDWLRGLRQASYADAKSALMTLRGVGEKIADCVCLFSLDKDEAVPVDVHIARIARRIFGEGLGSPSTAAGYARFAGAFRDRFGPKAGWAQQYLYYAEICGNGLWDEELGRRLPKTPAPRLTPPTLPEAGRAG